MFGLQTITDADGSSTAQSKRMLVPSKVCTHLFCGSMEILTMDALAFREMNITGEIGLKNDDFM